MNEVAQDVPPADVRGGHNVTGRSRRIRDRRPKIEPAMRSGLIVMIDVSPEGTLKVSSSEHERPVQALGPKGPYQSLAERVGVRGQIGVGRSSAPQTSSRNETNLVSRS